MNNRYDVMFKHLHKQKSIALIPFITIGDPSISIFMSIIDILILNGVNALELGIPCSDPIADGVTIQESYRRVLNLKINISQCLQIIQNIRKKYTKIPIGILVYAQTIYSYGINNFYQQSNLVGIDSILIVDIPIEEYTTYYQYSCKYNILPVLICPHNVNNSFWDKIHNFTCAYIYVTSRSGITGYNENNNLLRTKFLCKKILKYQKSLPVQGFGICNVQHIKDAIQDGMHGIIIGSYIIDIIKHKNNLQLMFQKLTNIILQFKKATFF
ncbi:tryptophan synthase subunit alpha [Enterobacteriaceae endosymbiont of Macroplea appendiculata]|uniref:tryptophan synthase subunit alpha n=1 Tax=Enterobacteriaceae endosymbiont of Macroplea appendiculata TaxID=2675790 RepID=UPI0014490284|nr:tryptophan synthase subunit alpha [Enterobacteriaceae endosymbiont of Macroplea appendiculata]QJC30718.1 tryptophan synthase subunit alpha [Enterobacteriaceae endosymbiont of Macroplea appendiculata]